MSRITLLLLVILLTGCSAKIVPKQVAGGLLDLKAGSQKIDMNDISISVRVQDLSYAPYRQVDNITSFYFDVQNRTPQPWSFPAEAVRLVASDGHQFSPVTPMQVKEMVSRELPYMVPYPYVGYYYLEDAQKGSHFNTFTSNLPYYASNHPQDIFTQALPTDAIEPGNRIAGLVYFVCDLTVMSEFEIRVKGPGTAGAAESQFVFPFIVDK